MTPELTPEQKMEMKTRRSFLALGAGAVVVAAGGAWLAGQTGVTEDGIPPVLRGILGFNEKVVRSTVYSNSNLAATFPKSAIGKIKANGAVGIDSPVDPAWKLSVNGCDLNLADIQSLPHYEEIIDFKCVEGWSTVTQFAGARLSDFTAKFAPGGEKRQFVGLQTPDKNYYVSLDMPGALHPQTLLAWEMNGNPLTPEHGAPLRLVIPVKYGIKNLKRIGRIEYTDQRPADYWHEQGYDWYAGL